MTDATQGTLSRVLLIGGTSEIGLAIISRMQADGQVQAHLLGRDQDAMTASLAGLIREGCLGGSVTLLDAEATATHPELMESLCASIGPISVVIMALGSLGAQAGLGADHAESVAVMNLNFTASGSLLMATMRALHRHGGGTVVVLSSVAAERPRAGNAVYGAAKAGIDALSQGLADAAPANVRVLVVRPGFVRTKMTAGLKPAAFATTPQAVADVTVRALRGKAHTVWAPPLLRYVFFVLRHLPRGIYRRLPI